MAKRNKKSIALFPVKLKYKRFHKFIASGLDVRALAPVLGNYAIKAIEAGRIATAELEASRRYLKRFGKKKGQVYMRIYPYLPITKKPGETRMGKGKSSRVADYVYPIRAGKIIFELAGFTKGNSLRLLNRVQERLAIKTKIVKLVC